MRSLELVSPTLFMGHEDLRSLLLLLHQSGDSQALMFLSRLPVYPPLRDEHPDLPTTELLVLGAIAQHRTVGKTADALFLSPNTIKFHLKNIYGKLDVATRKEALAKATTLGLL